MRAEQLEEGSVAGADQGKKVVSEFFGEWLLSAFRPDGVVAHFRALSELRQSSIHSGNIPIGWMVREVKRTKNLTIRLNSLAVEYSSP